MMRSSKQDCVYTIHKIFNNLLPKHLPFFEPRSQQLDMAVKILHSFIENKKCIIEAPTGVGKSLAYLIPSLVYLKEINKNTRIIVSTYTKTLQQQLFEKDLPIVNAISEEMYGEKINFMTFYGSENYICLSKFNELKQEMLTTNDKIDILQIENWLKKTETGCIEEIQFDNTELWQEMNREVDLCRGKHCKFYGQCLYYKNIARLKNMDIIIVNHYLFFANILLSNKLIPKSAENYEEIIIFDEAHNLEDVILQWLGYEVSNTQLKFLCKQIYNPKKQRGLVTKLHSLPDSWKQNTINAVANLTAAIGQFFSELNTKLPETKNEIRVFLPNIVEDVLTPALGELLSVLRSAKNMVATEEEMFKINSFIKRIKTFISVISLWLKCGDTKNFIYWIEREITKRKQIKLTLRITPLEVAYDMQQKVYSVYDKILFTSATLCVNNSFEFFKSSVGLIPEFIPNCTSCDELVLLSPFDFKSNVVLFLPETVPDPKEYFEEYKNQIVKIISELVNITEGNTFVLFTSFELMNWVYENINVSYEVLLQNTSKYKMLERYKKIANCVLFGVDTFWQGVDIPGEKLISIIIPKLPFDVPDHPITEAKAEKIELDGGDPFKEYILPRAVIKLKQGFGRLIRRKTDWGIISILDPRITTRWYGKFFLKSLPECQLTTNLEKLKSFIQSKKQLKA